MRNFRTAQRAALPAAAAVLGALVAGPAFADVRVSPATAVQCSGENLYFAVTNPGTKALRAVKLAWPADTPVAEVYPLSVDDWAPKIEMQTLSQPLTTIHGGTPVTETAKSITWLAMPGRALAPGKSSTLGVAIGPLPTISTMRFTTTTTYLDGTPGPVMPADLGLTPAADCQAAGHDGHAGTVQTGDVAFGPAVDDVAIDPAVEKGPMWSAIGGWVVAALAGAVGIITLLRGRRRAAEEEVEEDDEPTDTDGADDATSAETNEPLAVGKWSFRE